MQVHVKSHYELDRINNGLGGILLKEVPVKTYVRDFSKDAKATEFSEKFDIRNWSFFHKQGAILRKIDEYAYIDDPESAFEVQFIWYLDL